MKIVTDLSNLADKLRRDIETYKREIDKHESFAEDNPKYEAQIIKDLEAGRKDINEAIWIFHETRTSMISAKEIA
jgi:uncharacterized iron-regulated protein